MVNYIYYRKLGFIFLVLFVTIIIGGCNINFKNTIDRIIFYKKGNLDIIKFDKYNIEECLNNTTKQYTLLIMGKDISNIKQNNSAIEIIFKKEIKYTLKPINKTKKFNSIFIPLDGDYQKMLFLGNKNGYGAYTPYGLDNCNLIDTYIDKINQ